MSKTPTCATCRFYSGENDHGEGWCYRYPKALEKGGNAYCGEHEHLPKQPESEESVIAVTDADNGRVFRVIEGKVFEIIEGTPSDHEAVFNHPVTDEAPQEPMRSMAEEMLRAPQYCYTRFIDGDELVLRQSIERNIRTIATRHGVDLSPAGGAEPTPDPGQ